MNSMKPMAVVGFNQLAWAQVVSDLTLFFLHHRV
jgi:hypothetical protein